MNRLIVPAAVLLCWSGALAATDFADLLGDRVVITDPDTDQPIPMLLTADGYLLTRRNVLDPEADWNRAQRWDLDGDRMCTWVPGRPGERWCAQLESEDETHIRVTQLGERDPAVAAEYIMRLEPVDTALREKSRAFREMLAGRNALAEANGTKASVSFTSDGVMDQDTPGGARTMRWFVALDKLCIHPADLEPGAGQVNVRVQCNTLTPTDAGFRLDDMRAGQPVEFAFEPGG
jgi:hypothetical protein